MAQIGNQPDESSAMCFGRLARQQEQSQMLDVQASTFPTNRFRNLGRFAFAGLRAWGAGVLGFGAAGLITAVVPGFAGIAPRKAFAVLP